MNPIPKTNEWFIENGYADPMEMIDHNGNLDLPEAIIEIFVAYNQHNIAEGKAWDNWPEWELVLTSMKVELSMEGPENDTPKIVTERALWLRLIQFMHENDNIKIDGYTITIEGKHGHQFTFDMSIEHDAWVSPRCLAEHYNKMNASDKARPPWRRNVLEFFSRYVIEHSLGEYWICPEHVSGYGGKQTAYTHDNQFCIDKSEDDIFPLAMFSLIQLCIDDTEIWKMFFEQDIKDIEHHEFMEREWPGGRPDQDWEYQ
jgi:hypothetical protein